MSDAAQDLESQSVEIDYFNHLQKAQGGKFEIGSTSLWPIEEGNSSYSDSNFEFHFGWASIVCPLPH